MSAGVRRTGGEGCLRVALSLPSTYVVGDGQYVYTLQPQAKTKSWSTLKPTLDSIVSGFKVLR